MFKTVTNLFNSDNAKWLFVAIVLCIVAYSLLNYSNGKGLVMDGMSTGAIPSSSLGNEVFESNKPSNYDRPESIAPMEVQSGSDYKQVSTAAPQDLLPADKNSEFATLNPVNSNAGSNLPQDLLQAGSMIGVDTIGQTLKNPNLQ